MHLNFQPSGTHCKAGAAVRDCSFQEGFCAPFCCVIYNPASCTLDVCSHGDALVISLTNNAFCCCCSLQANMFPIKILAVLLEGHWKPAYPYIQGSILRKQVKDWHRNLGTTCARCSKSRRLGCKRTISEKKLVNLKQMLS